MLFFSGTHLADATHLIKAEPISSKSYGLKNNYKVCGDKICPKKNTLTSDYKTQDQTTIKNIDAKKQITKNDKKITEHNITKVFWEQYYKTSAPGSR